MIKMERSVDLSQLPTKKYGKKRNIDWEKAVGHKIPFCYDNIKGKLTVIEHQKKNYIVLRYKNKEKRMRTSHLSECKFRDLLFENNKLIRKIDFSSIPKKYGKNDWMNSKGCILPFCYDRIKGEMKIIDCKTIKGMTYLTIKYKNRIKDIRNTNLWNCKIANIIGYYTGDFIFEKGEKIIDKDRNLTIIGQKHYESAGIVRKAYQYHCNICGYIGWTDENAIRASKKVCRHCTNKVAIKGKDDIATQEPWMIKFFQEKDKHLVYKCRKTSNKKIYPICPYCGEVRNIKFQIGTIYKLHSIGCPKCSDGISYPEKFLIEIFKQMEIDILFHPTIKDISWAKPHFYDFYDPERKVIVEVNGMQHYEKVKTFAQSLEEVKRNDEIKKEKALRNGILESKYIQLDCRYSKKEYIKNSLLNNEKFNHIYNLNLKNIDWDKCHEQGMMSMYIKIYEYKQRNPQSTNGELANKFHVNKETVSKAINKIKKYSI